MNRVYIFIETANISQTLKILSSVKIDIRNVKYTKDGIKCDVSTDNLDYVSKLYNIKILRRYGITNIYELLKNNFYHLIVLIFGIALYLFLSQVIVSIKIDHPNKELISILYK